MINGKYFTCQHKGDLKKALETEEAITKYTFNCLTKSKLYEYYGYDERIEAKVYKLYKHHLNLGLPT